MALLTESLITVVTEVTQGGQGPLKGAMSAQKGSETETKVLLVETEDIFLLKGSLIFPAGKSIILCK